MWQAETWDPQTINRELRWARGLGTNTMRVFLHDLTYRQDPQGFLDRVYQFVAIAIAIAHYRAAAERTASIPERDYLTLKAARVAAQRPE